MDPVITEIGMAKGLPTRLDVWRRWQRHLTQVVQPQLDELARLKAERETTKRATR